MIHFIWLSSSKLGFPPFPSIYDRVVFFFKSKLLKKLENTKKKKLKKCRSFDCSSDLSAQLPSLNVCWQSYSLLIFAGISPL